jgi:hypothetical protein
MICWRVSRMARGAGSRDVTGEIARELRQRCSDEVHGGQRSGGTCLLRPGISDVNLFRYCQGVIYFDAQITNQCRLRADRIALADGWPLLVYLNQQTFSESSTSLSRALTCPTGNFRMRVMRKLPVVPICRRCSRLLRRANHNDALAHPASVKRDVSADRHDTWGGDAVDAVGT